MNGKPSRAHQPTEPPSAFRQWRQQHGLSQPAAAKALGYHWGTIARYDRGEKPIETALALAMEALTLRAVHKNYDTALNITRAALNLVPIEKLIHRNDLSPLAHSFAALEGWGLFAVNGQLEIQRDDTRHIFNDDSEALRYVKQQAQSGSQLHSLALALHNQKEDRP